MSCNIHRSTASSRLRSADPLDLVSQSDPPKPFYRAANSVAVAGIAAPLLPRSQVWNLSI
jgi:hypothetical protein